MSKKSNSSSSSASDWYEQMVSKLSTTTPTITTTTSIKTKSKQAPTTQQQQQPTKSILLSERPDLWDAASDVIKSKHSSSSLSSSSSSSSSSSIHDHTSNKLKRKHDQQMAKLDASDISPDDFLSNLMSNRTGDAFDDLASEVYQSKPIKSQKTKSILPTTTTTSKTTKKSTSTSTPSTTTTTTTTTTISKNKIEKETKSTKNNKLTPQSIVQLQQPISSQSTKPKLNTSQPKPLSKPIITNRYTSDESKIGTSTRFDNFHKSLPLWFMDSEYQLEVRRLITVWNKTKQYTPSPLAQWFPQQKVEELIEQHNDDDDDDDNDDDDDEEEGDEDDDIDNDSDDIESEENEQIQTDDESDEVEDEDDDLLLQSDDDNDDDDNTESGVLKIPAPISHQILILPHPDARLHALKDFYDNIITTEQSSRLKSKMLIIVRDGRTANQLICKIGLRVTKHKKNNRGMSNAGLTVETKGVDMIHERLTTSQRNTAFKKFQTGAVQTLIITDEYLQILWPLRQNIGIIIHYDIPMYTSKHPHVNNKKHEHLSPEALERQRQDDLRYAQHHVLNKMQERLSYLKRIQTQFPDYYYLPKEENRKYIPNPKFTLKNISLSFLVPTKSCQLFAKTLAPIYKNDFKAENTAQAMLQFAAQKQ